MGNERVDSAELAELAALIAPTARRLAERGHRLYFVGGIVRDLLLATEDPAAGNGPDFSDVDLTTDARPRAIKAALDGLAEAMWTQGERFGTIGAMVSDHAFEITTHRAEAYDEASRKPVVTFGDHVEVDLSRRDFTINAMAIEVTTQHLLDPFGGRSDLEHRRLRTPLDPAISFTDDPLRMLRAARFIPRFGLTAAPEVATSARELADRLQIVSGERIHDELEKLLAVSNPLAGLEFLEQTGLLGHIGLSSAAPHLEAIARLSTTRARRVGLLMELTDEDIEAFLSAHRYSNADRRSTKRLVAAVRRLATVLAEPVGVGFDAVLRSLAVESGGESLDDVLELGMLFGIDDDRLAAARAALVELRAREDLDDRRPPLEGSEVMAVLGVGEGPIIGQALDHLESLRIERGPLTADEARAELRTWEGAPRP